MRLLDFLGPLLFEYPPGACYLLKMMLVEFVMVCSHIHDVSQSYKYR